MFVAILWTNSLLACALMTSCVQHEGVPLRVFRQVVSTHNTAARETETQKRQELEDTTSSQPDTPGAHYGAHRIDRNVLFPHDTTWCVARPISQVIEGPGCVSRTIPNKMCAGQCYSYTVPKIFPHEVRLDFKSCDCCQPSRVNWAVIPLHCNAVDGHTVLRKHVEMVEECECKPCSLHTSTTSWITSTASTNDTEYSYDESSYIESSSGH